MNYRKLAALAVLFVLLTPGALAFKTTRTGVTAVKGHTVFVELVQEERNEDRFAAIAAVSIERQVNARNSVLWFNDQELIPGFENVVETCFSGNVIVVEAGSPSPSLTIPLYNLDLDGDGNPDSYIETYQFVDPNDLAWTVDRYDLPLLGPMFVVPTAPSCIIDPTLNVTNPASPTDFDDEDGARYNAVNLVRIDAFAAVVEKGATHPDALRGTDEGDSHDECGLNCASAVEEHFHATVLVDVHFSGSRPDAPTTPKVVVSDAIGSTAPFDNHPCTDSADSFAPNLSGCTPVA